MEPIWGTQTDTYMVHRMTYNEIWHKGHAGYRSLRILQQKTKTKIAAIEILVNLISSVIFAQMQRNESK